MSTHNNLFDKSSLEYALSGGYAEKARVLECISNGQAENVDATLKQYLSHLLDLLQDDMQRCRDAMYFVWAQFNMAATRAGLSEFLVSDIQDKYYRRLESCTCVSEALRLCAQQARELTEDVAALRREQSYTRTVSLCCAYVHDHIYERLSVESIAEALHFGKSYLSHKFSEETGTTVLEYIHREKINEAKILLHSHIPISDIAAELCFSSQSHFTSVFKRITGMTPMQFRKKK